MTQPDHSADGSNVASPARVEDERRLLAALGATVRRLRAERALTRRTLAETAGMSERYIAQLESGRGNVSVLLLHRLCGALQVPLPSLFAADGARAAACDDPKTAPAADSTASTCPGGPPIGLADIERALARLSATDIEALRGALERRASPPPRRIALVGLDGTGKTTLGTLLARRLGVPFVQLTDLLSSIRATEGESPAAYAARERVLLEGLPARYHAAVVEAPGQLAMRPANFAALRAGFFTVWIRASAAEIAHRLTAEGAQSADGAQDYLRAVLARREPVFALSARVLDTTGSAVEEALARLVRLVD